MTRVRWTARLEAVGGLDERFLATIPASHGVVCVTDHDRGVLALASTGDMRSFVGQRLGPMAEGAGDLRASAAACEIAPAGSMFEADLMFMDAAAEREPGLHDRVTRKLSAWWLGTGTDARRFAWSWSTNPDEFAPGCAVIGPFLEKSGARRHAEMLDGRFELCRFPAELHRAPVGKACVYMQMGRCPAPCDGSEPLEAFEARLQKALAFDFARASAQREALEREVADAAKAQAFEKAAEIKSRLDALASDMKRGLAAVRLFGAMCFVAVAKGPENGVALVLALRQGLWDRVGELSGDAGDLEAERVAVAACDRLDSLARRADAQDLGVLGLLSQELIRPSRGGPVLLEPERVDGPALLHAARQVLRITPRAPSGPRKTRSDE